MNESEVFTLADGQTVKVGTPVEYTIGADHYLFHVSRVLTPRQVVVDEGNGRERVVKLRRSKRGPVWSDSKLNRGRPVGFWHFNTSLEQTRLDPSF
jgi:hypothetical protein